MRTMSPVANIRQFDSDGLRRRRSFQQKESFSKEKSFSERITICEEDDTKGEPLLEKDDKDTPTNKKKSSTKSSTLSGMTCLRWVTPLSVVLNILLVAGFYLFLARDAWTSRDPDTPSWTNKLLIAVVADERSINELGSTVMETWGNDAMQAEHVDLRFFVGSTTENVPEQLKSMTVTLTNEDTYPPRKKNLEMWKVLHEQFDHYNYYMKVDIDAYVNIHETIALIDELFESRPHTRVYTGRAASGRANEIGKLGLNGEFCMGMGYIVGRMALMDVAKEIDWCVDHPSSEHSDTEFANCMFRASSIVCEDQGANTFLNMYFSVEEDGAVRSSGLNKKGQSASSHSTFYGPPLQATLIHPLKQSNDMRTLHDQITHGRRPMIPKLHAADEENSVHGQAKRFLDKACSNNPLVQYRTSGLMLERCPQRTVSKEEIDIAAIPAFVLNLDHRQEKFETMIHRFDTTSLDMQRFPASNGKDMFDENDLPFVIGVDGKKTDRRLSVGELGYLDSMRRVIQHAKDRDMERIIVFDDDVTPHREFDDKLKELLADSQCGGNMMTKNMGGTLQLGSTVWGYWPVIDDFRAKSNTENHICHDSFENVFGTFAVMYHRNTYDAILKWIQDSPNQPFDWVFGHLAREGYVTNAAYPHLVVPDITGASDVDNDRADTQHDMAFRSKKHRWDLSNFVHFWNAERIEHEEIGTMNLNDGAYYA